MRKFDHERMRDHLRELPRRHDKHESATSCCRELRLVRSAMGGAEHAESRCLNANTYHDWIKAEEVTPKFMLPALRTGGP